MSLILDALKKSEAERRRGLPPTLHVQFGASPRRMRRTPWVAGAGAVLLAAGIAGGWLWTGRARDGVDASATVPLAGTSGSAATAAPGPAQTPVADAPRQLAAVPQAVATTFATARPESAVGSLGDAGGGVSVSGGGMPVPERAGLYTPSVDPQPSYAGTAPPPAPAPAAPAPVSASPSPAADAAVAAAVSAPPSAAVAPAPPPPAPAPALAYAEPPPQLAQPEPPKKAEDTLLAVHELPYTTRKDLPKLELSMHVYSPEPGESFVVLNGKRYGADSPPPGPELELLSIVADGVVLEFRGQRFLLPRQTF